MKILVINAGSSSLKYQLVSMTDKKVMAKGLCEKIGLRDSRIKFKPADGQEVVTEAYMKDHSDAISLVLAALLNKDYGVISSMDEISAVGHRVVHGGELFSGSVVITNEVKQALEQCTPLAPLHNPANLIGIAACEKAMPGVPEVAVFDTAFHQTMPALAYMYALPYELYEKYKIRRYGFHGTSHRYVSAKAAELLGRPLEELKLVTCHLGNGSSVTAVDHGKSVDTSMGFTPLEGVMMGTRCGSLDPAILTFLMHQGGLDADAIDRLMNKDSGLRGVSGVSSDFRDLSAAIEQGNKRAELAVDMFYYSVKKYIGAYAAAMGGLDAVVFTAGIGENNSDGRLQIVKGLEFMGIQIDQEKNSRRGVALDVSAQDASVRTLVIPTDEEMMIAMDTMELTRK